jgi:hypothetical protein
MMTSKRNTLLTALSTLGAVLAICGIASAATPEISPTPTKASPLTFTGHSTADVVLEASNGSVWDCRSLTLSGEISSSTEVTAKGQFTECGGKLSGSFGPTELLHGSLGYIEYGATRTGLLLAGSGTEEVFAKNFGFPTVTSIFGGVIGNLTPVNTQSNTLTLKYEVVPGTQTQSPNAFACNYPKEFECVIHKEYKAHALSWDTFSLALKTEVVLENFKKGGVAVKVEVKA